MNSFKQSKTLILWRLMPLLGSVLFILLYVSAALYYPGGTNTNKTLQGFSWTQNYWCNLLNENGLNGQHNPARPIAFTAMAVLALTLSIFWYQFPGVAGFKRKKQYIIQASGFMSMATSVFIFTSLHDTIIDVAGLFGLIALIGTLIGLRKLHWSRLFYIGLLIVVLIGLNNLFYYQKSLMYLLPVVQKITFLTFLLWICSITIQSFNQAATDTNFAK